MDQTHEQRSRELLINLRKITQAIDLHSKFLSKNFGLTGPQLVILQELSNHEPVSVSELAKLISLSQATVTDIVTRLEKRELLTKKRSEVDKRRVMIFLTDKGRELLDKAPSPLQDKFIESFYVLEDWEQLMIISSMSRIVSMMSAERIDASPILLSGPIQGKDEK